MQKNTVPIVRRVRVKLLAIILLTVGIFTALFISYGMKETKKALHVQSDLYGTSLARGIATTCSNALHTGDYISLQSVIETVGSSYEQIRAIEIYVTDKLVAKYSSLDSLGSLESRISEKGDVYSAPIRITLEDISIDLGRVAVVLSENRLYDFYVQQIHTSVFLGLILLAEISILLFLLMNYLIVKPVATIEQGTQILAQGNLDHRIVVHNKDEIGKLADAFNSMAVRLKQSKEEIERWNHILEQRVRERTHELEEANRQLKEAQYQLIQTGKMAAIGLIGAGVAHELNNPLGGIIGYAQLVLSKMKTIPTQDEFETCKKYLSYIDKESKRCQGIVDNLLHFARGTKTAFEKIDIQKVLVTTLSIMEGQLHRWHISIIQNFQETPMYIKGSSNPLQQVFMNLITNAHTAMSEKGTITFTVRFEERYDTKMVAIDIADTGCGIPQDRLVKIFNSFFTTQKQDTNLGLGLWIVQNIVEDHNGSILVESEVGKGTTFTIMFPMV